MEEEPDLRRPDGLVHTPLSEEFQVPPGRHYGMTWREKMGNEWGKPGLAESTPEYIVANLKDLKATENTSLRKVTPETKFPLSYDDMADIARLKWKFENDPTCFSLSSPQLGLPQRALVYYKPTHIGKIKIKEKFPVYTLLNPSYEPVGDEMHTAYETCTSVKNVCGLVYRFETIKVKGYDVTGELIESEEIGAVARWIQHEVDHLNGILFTDQAATIITKKEHNFRRRNGKLIFYLDV